MTDFNDFVVAASNRTSPAKTDKVPIVIDGSTATGHVTAAQLRFTSELTLPVSNPASAYTLPTTHALVSITGLDHALTINAPASGISGETQEIEVRIAASGADRIITPSGFTIVGAGTTFTVASGTTEIFYAQWTGSAWEWSGHLTASKVVNVPAGNIAATTVQAAIDELDTEKVTSGGALGTPSSGTLTNCTGLPVAGLANVTGPVIAGRLTAGSGAVSALSPADSRAVVEQSPNSVLTSVSGSLTTATHNGKILVTSGNVTVPNASGDVGFSAIIIAGGAHTVTFNSLVSAAMAAGDVMTVVVQSTTVIKAVKTAAADLVSFS